MIVDITVGMSEGLDESLAGRLFVGKGVDAEGGLGESRALKSATY